MSQELQLKIGAIGYRIPNISILDIASKQHSTLSLLRENTVRCLADINEKNYCILVVFTSVINPNFRNSAQKHYCLQIPSWWKSSTLRSLFFNLGSNYQAK